MGLVVFQFSTLIDGQLTVNCDREAEYWTGDYLPSQQPRYGRSSYTDRRQWIKIQAGASVGITSEFVMAKCGSEYNSHVQNIVDQELLQTAKAALDHKKVTTLILDLIIDDNDMTCNYNVHLYIMLVLVSMIIHMLYI